MSSSIRRDLSAAVLDHQDLGKLCGELVRRGCEDLAGAGFDTLYTSGTSIEDKQFGNELLCFSRLLSRDGETPIALCVRLTCSATSKPKLACTGTFELHRNEDLERPQRNGEGLLAERTLLNVVGVVILSTGLTEEEVCRDRHAVLVEALRGHLDGWRDGQIREFVDEALAP